MSGAKTSENFYGQDEYHQAYFHDIDAPPPLKKDRVDPNLPDLKADEVVDPDMPEAPTRSGREESGGEAKASEGGSAKTASKPKPSRPSASDDK